MIDHTYPQEGRAMTLTPENIPTIYVDEVRNVFPAPNAGSGEFWLHSQASHLCCIPHDNNKLHAFAESIGLKRGWFRDRKEFPHYDLTPKMRDRAIKAGANSSKSFKELVRMNQKFLGYSI